MKFSSEGKEWWVIIIVAISGYWLYTSSSSLALPQVVALFARTKDTRGICTDPLENIVLVPVMYFS